MITSRSDNRYPTAAIFLLVAALLAGPLMAQDSTRGDEFGPRPLLADNPLVEPGSVIDSGNLDQYRTFLAPALAELVSQNAVELTTGAHIRLPIHPAYVTATQNNVGAVSLGPNVGDMDAYVQGRPFPGDLDPQDPRSGEKAAWNMRYGYGPDETETLLMSWRYKNMVKNTEERSLEMYGALMRFDHRHTREPTPALEQNPAELFSALYLKVDFPYDIRNTQLLTHTKLDDGEAEQAWIYLNTQRRVKRLGTGQKTDAFLGSDIMIEDFLGYNGRIRDMHWRYEGTTELLAPVYGFDQLPDTHKTRLGEHTVIDFHGLGACFPKVTWQPRTVHRIRATPVDEAHPISSRLFFMDAATFAPLMTQIYDRSETLWKLGIVAVSDSSQHGPENAAWQGAITDGVSMIDVQAGHCTTIQFRVQIPERGLRAKLFTTQQMRSAGR